MSLLKFVMGLAVAATLAACGGGGGSAGTTGGATTGGGTTGSGTTNPVSQSTLTIGFVGGGRSIDASGATVAQATVRDASGALVSGRLVTFTSDPLKVKFSPASGQVLTVNGVASIQVIPASLTADGAGSLVATAKVGDSTPTDEFDFQLAAANLGLLPLDLGLGSLPANGNRAISVRATVNGAPATNTPVQVAFSASCGTVAPAVVQTDSTGTASTTYTANVASCAGTNVTITGSAVGATSVSGVIAVAPAIATNVKFISTTPQLIYLKDSVGTTQAQVVFKVVDSGDNPLQNKKLRLSLSNTATGVSLSTLGNVGSVDFTTDNSGLVSAAVFAGTVPTSLNVKAILLDASNAETAIFSSSNLLTVASGRPTQRSLSLAVEKLSIEAKNVDGVTTSVTLSMADRQGNPVPPGTQVNFVAETGVLLPAVCFVPPVVPATESSPAIPVSACTVTFRSQGTRTANGRVSILAYVAGEEDFVDVDGNNVFSAGDTFTNFDLGLAFRDDNGQAPGGANGVYDTGEFQVPRDSTANCTKLLGCPGDGVWGAADVRQQATVIFASSNAVITSGSLVASTPIPQSIPITNGLTTLAIVVSDENGNSMPTGSTIEVKAVDNGVPVPGFIVAACNLSNSASYTVPNSAIPFSLIANLQYCTAGDNVQVKVTSPSGVLTERFLTIQ